jgi:hypothetical protein
MQRYPWEARKNIWSSNASALKGPAVAEDHRLYATPVLVIDLCAFLESAIGDSHRWW